MNRSQFVTLTVGSSLVVLFLILQVFLARGIAYQQNRLVQAQQVITEGRACDTRVRQLAARIYQVAQQTNDAALKDLLTRQQVTVTTPAASATTPAPATTAPASNP